MSLSNYPPGVSDTTVGAPWNEESIPEKEFEVTCSQCLSRTASVWTDNYIPGASGVDYEPDGEGGYCASGWHDEDDTSDTNWADEYHDNDHYTPIQLISLFRKYLEEELNNSDIPQNRINKYKHLIEECDGWTDDETEYIKEN